MQVKSQSKYLKTQIDLPFINRYENRIIQTNVVNINEFFNLFQQIKQHRTLQKLCQVYTLQEKEQILKSYQKLIDRVEEMMEKFVQYAQNTKRKYIVLERENYTLQQWVQAVQIVYLKGSKLLSVIEGNLKMIMKAFNMNAVKLPSVNWEKWKQNCIKPLVVKVNKCGCFC